MKSLLTRLFLAIALCSLLVVTAPAIARDQVVVLLLSDAPRSGLVDALKIQLPEGTRVLVGPPPRSKSTGERVREAQRALARDRRGAVALWLDEDYVVEGEREVVVYLVSRREGRALVEIVRVRGGADEELERTIALKAREVLDAIGVARPDLPRALAPRDEVDPSLLLELALFGATSSATADPQLGGHAAIGFALEGESWLGDTVAFVRVPTRLSGEFAEGLIEIEEIVAGGSIRALWVADRFALGGNVGVGARILSAEGTTVRGTPGSAERVLPFVAFGPELRVTIVGWLRARTMLGAEVALARQRFALNEVPLLDLGPVRGVAEIGLVASLF